MVPTMKRLLCLAVVVAAQAAVADQCRAQSKAKPPTFNAKPPASTARPPASRARPSAPPAPPAPSYRKEAPYMVVEHDVFDRSEWTPRPAPTRHDYFGDMKAGLHANKSVPSLNQSRTPRMPGYGGMGGGGMGGMGGMFGPRSAPAHHAAAASPYSSSLVRPFR